MVREMQPSDLEEVLMISEECFNSDAWSRQAFEKEFNLDYSYRFVLEEEGEIIGYAVVWQIYDEATIMSIAIKKDRWGKGYGKRLMEFLIEYFKGKVSRLVLDVRRSNIRAIRLYQSLGFKIISFKEQGGVWPPHCVQNTEGALFHKDLFIPQDNRFIISKGTSKDFDAYSGFQGTVLDSLLRERGIRRVFVGGVATDYCVKNTVLGAINLGYEAFLLLDGIKGVGVNPGDSERAIEEMLRAGAVGISIEDIG